MKKSIILAALCIVAAGCSKESVESLSPSSPKMVPVSLNIGAPSTKVALDGSSYAQSWEAGDEVAISSYYKDADAVYHCYLTKMTASGSGASSQFAGTADAELFTYPNINNFVVTPYSAITSYKTNSAYLSVPSDQTGKISDFGKYSIAYSRTVKLEKQADSTTYAFPASLGRLINFTTAIKFNIAAGNDVRKVVITGYNAGEVTMLAAEKSDGAAIQVKFSSPQLYRALTDVNPITIERSEEISGDVYAVIAPNFPQTSDKTAYQWEDGKYDFNDSTKVPYNMCDSLVFTFTNSAGSEVTYGRKLNGEKVLRSGKILNLGAITSIPFPGPEIVLSVGGPKGKLGCTPALGGYTYVYEMTTDGTEPADPTVSSTAFPADSLAFNEAGETYEVKMKVAQVYNGSIVSTKNVLLRKSCVPSSSTDITLAPGESAPFGFMSFNNIYIDPDNNHANEVQARVYCGSNWIYKCMKLDANGEVTSSSYAAKGETGTSPFKTSFTFKATYPGAECALYTKLGKTGRKMALKYVEDGTVIKDSSTGYYTSSDNTSWSTGEHVQFKTVKGNGDATLFIYTDYTSFNGFAWIEQGFASFK